MTPCVNARPSTHRTRRCPLSVSRQCQLLGLARRQGYAVNDKRVRPAWYPFHVVKAGRRAGGRHGDSRDSKNRVRTVRVAYGLVK
jgi:hypothetical protein